MRKIGRIVLLFVLGFATGRGVINPSALYGMQTATHYHGIAVEQHAFGQAVDRSISFWRTETARRFPDAVLIVGHGGTLPDGQWGMLLQEKQTIVHVRDVVKVVQAKYPGRTVVMICCNPQGLSLHMAGVYHAVDSVWFYPDRALPGMDAEDQKENLDGRKDEPGLVGNIFEFNED